MLRYRLGPLLFLALVSTLVPAEAQTPPDTATTRAGALRAAREAKAREMLTPDEPTTGERIGFYLDDRIAGGVGPGLKVYGFSPVLGGLQSGAGITLGVRFAPLSSEAPVLVAADVRGSLKGYWGAMAEVGTETGPLAAYGYGRFRHLPAERFFGLGPDREGGPRADYRLDETTAGGVAAVRVAPGLSVGASAAYLVNAYGSGTDDAFPDVEDVYDATTAPGVGTDLTYAVAGGVFEFDTRRREQQAFRDFGRRFAPTQGLVDGLDLADVTVYTLEVAAARYFQLDDSEGTSGTGDFTRLDANAQQVFPFRNGFHSLAFREYGSFTLETAGDQPDDVPFYLLPALGGSQTLRGFDPYRFRDRNALLLTTEYRYQVWRLLGVALFLDAGRVASEAGDLFGTPELGYGVGLRVKTRERAIGRVDFARSREGFGIYLSVGSSL